jgi:hypothetical protein
MGVGTNKEKGLIFTANGRNFRISATRFDGKEYFDYVINVDSNNGGWMRSKDVRELRSTR